MIFFDTLNLELSYPKTHTLLKALKNSLSVEFSEKMELETLTLTKENLEASLEKICRLKNGAFSFEGKLDYYDTLKFFDFCLMTINERGLNDKFILRDKKFSFIYENAQFYHIKNEALSSTGANR